MTIVNETRDPIFIDDHLGRHAAQFEQVYFLPIQLEHAGIGVGQAGKRQIIRLPESFECFRIFRAHHYHPGLPFYKLLMIKTQLRHMLLAKRSYKSAVENQQDIRYTPEIRQFNDLSFIIFQGEVRSRRI